VLTAQIDVLDTKYPDFARRTQFFQAVLGRVRALPTVTSAGFTSVLPFTWKSGMGAFSGWLAFNRTKSCGPTYSMEPLIV